MEGFLQKVATNEDVIDKIERALTGIIKDAREGKFGMGITGTNARRLLDILKSGDLTAFTNFVTRTLIERTNQMTDANERRDFASRYWAYLNGLKYIWDHRDVASVYIGAEACAIISFYFLKAFSGELITNISRGRTLSFSEFYRGLLENGYIG